jgi:RNA 3'-terminal phosphate cyclase (ATP)
MKKETITIDGSLGEGGGQILRTALALSLITGQPLKIEKIRAGREKPGLQRQHLAAVRAAPEISGALVNNTQLGSSAIDFSPGPVAGGDYSFAVGSAGSVTLVLQTVLPALMFAPQPSQLTLEGGTHNPGAPPADFLEKVFLPLLNRMGPTVTAKLEKYGFYPAGGGRLHVHIQPAEKLERLDLPERGALCKTMVAAIVSDLPESIGQREVDFLRDKLPSENFHASVRQVPGPGPGNAVFIEIVYEKITELMTAFGKRGVSSETVAATVLKEARTYMATGAPVGPHLADQLLLPMSLAQGGSFTTGRPTKHMLTNIDVIKHFLDINIAICSINEKTWQVEIG